MEKTSDSNGWICLHRKIRDNPIYEKGDYLRIWIELLLTASHKETTFIWNNKKQILKAGQLITGRKVLAEKTGIAESQVYKILKYLETEHQIEQQKTTKFTIITIVNWSRYQEKEQQKEQQSNNRVTTKEQQSNTYNNVNNDNNDNNTISKDIGKTNKSNPDINELVNYLREKVGSLDDTTMWNRRYARHLLTRLKKEYPDKDPVATAKALIDIGLADSFHSKNMTSFKYIYGNQQKILRSYQASKQGSNQGKTINIIK